MTRKAFECAFLKRVWIVFSKIKWISRVGWIHHYTPERKKQSKQWIEAGGSAAKKAKRVPSAGKVMATVFWDYKNVSLIDYLQKEKTINSEYYCSLLDQLRAKICIKRPALKKKRIIFHQDNSCVHTSVLTMAKFKELNYELFEHPCLRFGSL